MRPEEMQDLGELADRFDSDPMALSVMELTRMERLLTVLSEDVTVPSARQLAASLLRAAIRDWRIRQAQKARSDAEVG